MIDSWVEIQTLNLPSAPSRMILIISFTGELVRRNSKSSPLVLWQKVKANIMLKTPSPHACASTNLLAVSLGAQFGRDAMKNRHQL